MSAYSTKEYWTDVAQNFGSADEAGLAPVLHPKAPPWFNQCIDKLQYRAIRRALVLAELLPGARILDVGCGTGRWVRRFRGLGLDSTGVDATLSMLRWAREHDESAPLLAGEAHRLPFVDAAFDCVSDITVVQHIPASLQPHALAEMVRVLKPGGRLLLMELIRGKGSHIFPRSPQDWIEQVASRGMELIGWFGQEFLLMDRLFVRVARALAGPEGDEKDRPMSVSNTAPRHSSAARRAYWGARHIAAPLSAWADPFVEKICPGRLATHGVFIFKK